MAAPIPSQRTAALGKCYLGVTWERAGGQQRFSPSRPRAWPKRYPGAHTGSITLPWAQGQALVSGGAPREEHRKRRRPWRQVRSGQWVTTTQKRRTEGGQQARAPQRPELQPRGSRYPEDRAGCIPGRESESGSPGSTAGSTEDCPPYPRLCKLTGWGGRLGNSWHLWSITWPHRPGTLGPGADNRPSADHGLPPAPSAGGRGGVLGAEPGGSAGGLSSASGSPLSLLRR